MSRDLRQLLHDTATEPTRPLDASAVVGRARRRATAMRTAAATAVIVAVVGAGVGLRALFDAAEGPAPEILNQPGGESPSPSATGSNSPSDRQAHVLFFREGGDENNLGSYVLVRRESDRRSETPQQAKLEFALRELVRGPTEQEREQGLASVFSSGTAEIVKRVSVADGHATVDFQGLHESISQLSTTGVSTGFALGLKGTVFAIGGVDSVEFTLEGDCEAFWESIESSCHVVTRADWEQTLREHGTPSSDEGPTGTAAQRVRGDVDGDSNLDQIAVRVGHEASTAVIEILLATGRRTSTTITSFVTPHLYGAEDINGDGGEEVVVQTGGASVAVVTMLTWHEGELVQVQDAEGSPYEFQLGDANPGSAGAACENDLLRLIDYRRDSSGNGDFADSGTVTITDLRLDGQTVKVVDRSQQTVEKRPESAGKFRCGDVEFLGA